MSEGRIIGGNFAPIASVPWTCSQQRLGSHRCECAIISPTATITAAHCAYNIPGNGFYIRAGSDSKSRDGQLIPTIDVAIHPQFNEAILENDICVMFLASVLNTAIPAVAVINMVSSGSSLPSGTIALVSGWGPLYENGTGNEILRSIRHPVFAIAECRQRLGDDVTLTHDMICVGLDAGGVAACEAGSPLVTNGELAGVMSWSIGCGRPGLPSVYTLTSTARLWIEFAMGSHTLQSLIKV